MKKLLAAVSAVTICMSTVGSVALAATPNNLSGSQTMVFVGKDVTQQDHYTWTFSRPLQNGEQQSATVPAPVGSLFEFHETTLADAIANHETYVLVQGNSSQQGQEMQQLRNLLLHSEGIKQLPNMNPFSGSNSTSTAVTTTSATATTTSGPTYGAEGNFLCGSYNVYDDYTVYYTEGSPSNVEPTSVNEHLSADPTSGILSEYDFWFDGYQWTNPTALLSTSIDYNTLADLGPTYADVISLSGASFEVEARGDNGSYYSGSIPIYYIAPA